MKDKESRRSKGVAFVLFLEVAHAWNAVKAINNTEVIMHIRMMHIDLTLLVVA